MKTWIWPFSLYQRISDLEEIVAKLAHHNDELKKSNKELANQLAAESISNASMGLGYVEMVNSISWDNAKLHRQLAEFDAYYRRIEIEAQRAAGKATPPQE